MANGGNFEEYMHKARIIDPDHKVMISDQNMSAMLKSLFEGLQFMHERGILHRDVKPSNLLLCQTDDLTSVKFADFGLATQLRAGGFHSNEMCGTLLYQAPEQANDETYGKVRRRMITGEGGRCVGSWVHHVRGAQWEAPNPGQGQGRQVYLQVKVKGV